MVERKVRWNRETDTGEQVRLPHRYVVAIVNEPREIARIRQKFLEQMLPVDDFREITEVPISDSNGVHAYIFSFSSGRFEIENRELIYKNLKQFRRDRNLADRSETALLPYIERLVV
jgi:hypothetical protein